MDLRSISDQARAQYKPQLVTFYTPYFGSPAATEQFVERCHSHMEQDPTPARILHNTERLIGTADDLLGLRRGRDGHLILFSMFLVEAIHQLAEPGSKRKKVEIVEDFFKHWVSADDQKALQNCIQRSTADERYEGIATAKLRIETIARIFNQVRNDFAHEGIAWGFHFTADSHVANIELLEFAEFAGDAFQERTLDVSLTRSEYRDIVIRGAINRIQSLL